MICTFLCGICSIGKGQITAGDSLVASGQYMAARVAYERVLFGTTEPDAVFAASVGKARCLKQQGSYAAAVTFLYGQLQSNLPDSLLYQLRYEQVLCAYLAGQFENTLSLVGRLPYLHPKVPPSPVLLVVKVLALNELQRWSEADTAYHELAMLVTADSTLPNPYRELPRLKNEKKAQWLSTFIPGGGQLYAGRPGEAALSILIQSAGLYFGIASFVNGYYLSAWGIGAGLFGSFHAGGVRRAEVLVRQRNQQRANAFNAQLRERVTELVK